MQLLRDREIGVMFWAGRDAVETHTRVEGAGRALRPNRSGRRHTAGRSGGAMEGRARSGRFSGGHGILRLQRRKLRRHSDRAANRGLHPAPDTRRARAAHLRSERFRARSWHSQHRDAYRICARGRHRSRLHGGARDGAADLRSRREEPSDVRAGDRPGTGGYAAAISDRREPAESGHQFRSRQHDSLRHGRSGGRTRERSPNM